MPNFRSIWSQVSDLYILEMQCCPNGRVTPIGSITVCERRWDYLVYIEIMKWRKSLREHKIVVSLIYIMCN